MKPKGATFDKRWRAACALVPVSRAQAQPMIERHYLKRWPGVVVLSLGLRHEGIFKGVIVFALPPIQTAKRYGGVTWELARLWIEDTVPRNGESYVIGRAIRYIKQHHTTVEMLVSYADPSAGHNGRIYLAANWKPDGKTDQERKTPRFDYRDKRTGKLYSRRSHVPVDAVIERVPRVSKFRYTYKVKP